MKLKKLIKNKKIRKEIKDNLNFLGIKGKRRKRFIKQNKELGVNDFQTYDLGHSFYLWFYTGLSLYNNLSNKMIDTSFHTIVAENGDRITFQQSIDRMLVLLEGILTDYYDFNKESELLKEEFHYLFRKSINLLWW